MAKRSITLAILKPDIIIPSLRWNETPIRNSGMNPKAFSEIEVSIKKNGFEMLATIEKQLTIEEAEEFYKEHRGKFFYPRLVSFMTSGPVKAYVLQRENAIEYWRNLIGPTHALRARTTAPESIRAKYGYSDTRNAAHGSGTKIIFEFVLHSDSEETAKREISFFFPKFDFNLSKLENR